MLINAVASLHFVTANGRGGRNAEPAAGGAARSAIGFDHVCCCSRSHGKGSGGGVGSGPHHRLCSHAHHAAIDSRRGLDGRRNSKTNKDEGEECGCWLPLRTLAAILWGAASAEPSTTWSSPDRTG